MDADRWERIQSLFHSALDLPESTRRQFLEREASGDGALVAEVEVLLEEDARGASLLDRNIGQVASAVLDNAIPNLELSGPYRILKRIGQGGMGVVFLAEREDIGSRVAIKMLRDASLSPLRKERFALEQRTLAQLTHPFIARLYDADALPDGTPYFVMEYVEGVPLTAYCDANNASVEERLRLFRAVCEAVQFAHRHAIVHRDLKPSNVLVTADGTVKLLDFGIAKQLEAADVPADQTQTALRLMTPAYAAPEQIRGEPVGIYTDVYALGCILYELLTGKRPFEATGRTAHEVERAILEQDAERPSLVARRSAKHASVSVRDGAWADLDVLCLTAMNKDPQRRYRTVDALVRDIDHFTKGQPLEARPDSLGYRTGKFVRRNWRVVSAAAAVGVAAIALVTFYTVRLAAARDAALEEAARTQRIQQFVLRLFEGGDEAAGPADSLHVVTLVDRGVQEARMLVREPALQAELFETLGGIYHKLGNLNRADSLLRNSLDRRRSLLGADHPDVAASLVSLGLLRVSQAELDDGEKLVRDALDIYSRTLPAQHPAVAKASIALGTVLEERGEYDQAITVLAPVVAQQSASGEPTPELSNSLTHLANTHFYAGNLESADSLNRLILPINRRLYGERHPSVADILINLGAVQFERGRYGEAERYYREALEIKQAFHGPDHPETGSALTMLGRALVFQEQYDDATTVLERARGIQERALGPDHPRVASLLNELGNVASAKGDLPAAADAFERMAGIYRRAHGERHYYVAVALSNLATVRMKQERYPLAEQMFRDVVARFAEAQSPDHLNTGIARIKLGRSLVRQKRFAEAEKEILAGFAIVSKQTEPGVTFLQAAREDLAIVYEALGRPAEAERQRAEWKKHAEAASK